MNIFDKWLYGKVRDMWENKDRYEEAVNYKESRNIKMGTGMIGAQAMVEVGRSVDANGFNLKVYKANGGTIIETRKYDNKRDTSSNGLYIVTDDKDLGEEIGKIITMEGLKA